MRVTVTVRGDLEKYVLAESDKTGLSSAMVLMNLALSGLEYKESLNSFIKIASVLDNQNDSNLVLQKKWF